MTQAFPPDLARLIGLYAVANWSDAGAACAGDLATLKWLDRNLPELARRELAAFVAGAYGAACAAGCLDSVRWLSLQYPKLSFQSVLEKGTSGIGAACARGHFEVVDWILGHFGLSARHALHCGAMYQAVTAGRNDAIAFLLRPSLQESRRAETDGRTLQLACAVGYLGFAQWLVASRGLTPADAHGNGSFALYYAAKYGHTETADWLTGEFGPPSPFRRALESALAKLEKFTRKILPPTNRATPRRSSPGRSRIPASRSAQLPTASRRSRK